MNVLHVVPMDLARGAQTYARALRDDLREGSDRHAIVTLFEPIDAVLAPEHRLDVPFGLPRKLGFDPRVALRLAALVDTEHPDVLVAHGGESLKYALTVANRSSRGPAVVAFRIGLSTASGISEALFGRQLRASDHIVGVSEELIEESCARYGADPRHCTLIPNGRDHHVYAPAAVPPDEPHLIWIGAFDDNKRPELFIAAVGTLRKQGVSLRASMVGNGDRFDSLRAAAKEAGVDLLGRRSDVPDLLRTASALVLTSRLEGMPGVFIEAGLTGLPVVTTPVSGAPAVLGDEESGVIAKPDDLADVLATLLADPDRMERLGRRARERCVERFSLQATTRAWTDVLHAL